MKTDFLTQTTGAVTADWVVLTAGLVGLGFAVSAVVSAGLNTLSSDLNLQLESDHIGTSFYPFPGQTGINIQSVDYTNWTMSNSGSVTFVSSGGTDDDAGYILTIDDPGYVDRVTFGDDFTGDQADLFGGSLNFDMNMMAGGGGSANTDLLMLTANDGTVLVYTPSSAVPDNSWTNYNIPFTPTAEWTTGSGDPVDDATMQAVLSDLASTQLRVDQRNGYEELAIDNVTATRQYQGLNYDGS